MARHALMVGILGILTASCTPGGDEGNQESADLILTGARIFTSNQLQPWAETVAIKGDRFIYVGDSAGAQVFRSDNTQFNPYFGMQVGHTRKYPREWREEEELTRPPKDGQLSIEQIIMGYTQNGEYQLRMENEVGSIEKGKLADLIVLDDNLFDMDSDKIWKVKPAAVLMQGEVIQGSLPEEIQE